MLLVAVEKGSLSAPAREMAIPIQHAIKAMLKQGGDHVVQITTTLVEHVN
ncbi:hypothetical protein FHS21_004951 [Phyllobacterium trifolii]|uniref:Uncharacterized protein n=1 Tax=Phyllobacterium trifolii TaxID=300193 RepID=A0A839UFD0_9HYPH|nr:hypothetical protein [Phyllobacterium trifolii]MBB3148503.1 hypothetical protein [Phyllobacterium trifolii]